MTTYTVRRLTGLLLIVVPIAFTIFFTLLQITFEYPAILGRPTADILTKFQAGGAGLIAAWYGLTLTAVLFIPLVVLFRRVLDVRVPSATLSVATTFGVVAGLTQALGFLRWPFLAPHLAHVYLDPAASEAQRAAAALVFEAFHRYAGMAIGEHFGFLSTSVWTFLVALLMLRTAHFGPWLGASGMLLAVGIAAGLLAPLGWGLADTINALSYLAWALWLVVVGVVLLRRADPAVEVQGVAVAP
ncbi:MAG TPA: DUF4386 family protein [Roseiflexaceae bacterium]|nr:DUF4386 family protein [Roseiflexaceae bacterium]